MQRATYAKIYPNALSYTEVGEFDPNEYNIMPGDTKPYIIGNKIGSGKFSNVYEGSFDDIRVVIKVLKPIKLEKVKREVMILRRLEHTRIIKLLEVVGDKELSNFSLIFPYYDHEDLRYSYQSMESDEKKYFLVGILEGLDYAHSRGIIHRDLKPGNIIFHRQKKIIKIIDWGLSEFYFCRKSYNTNVGTRHYKAPELLLDYRYYDYAIDMWAFGCIFLEMYMGSHSAVFRGKDNKTQLLSIVDMLGTNALIRFCKKYNIENQKKLFKSIDCQGKKKSLSYFISRDKYPVEEYQMLAELYESIMVYDHQRRLTASSCLDHQYFKGNR